MNKIMVVDDERQILDLTKNLLEKKGYDVITCEDAQSCLEKLKEEKVNLVLMDYFMPFMNGMETIEKIRSEMGENSLKIALYTVADYSEFSEDELRKLNVIDFIHKPFDNDELIIRVESALNK